MTFVSTPVPPGRGRWRLTLHRRAYQSATYPAATTIVELLGARSRRLEQTLNGPAKLTFTMDGQSSAAGMIVELAHDVIAWRWSDALARDVLMFRGVVSQSEDEITEQSDSVNFTCFDYLSMLARRYVTQPATTIANQVDQDSLVSNWVSSASNVRAADGPPGTSFLPGSYLPLTTNPVDQAGNARASSGVLRDRTWFGSASYGQMIDDLAHVIGGFDYDLEPRSDLYGQDRVRVFYPSQGVLRPDAALVYGSSVAGLTRAVNSADYANYQRLVGQQTDDTSNLQVYSEKWNADANSVSTAPQGLWMATDNAADVSQQATLDEQAAGALALSGQLVPSYSLTLRPGWYVPGSPSMGDTVPLVVQAGRLDVDTVIRVVGIAYAVGDDGQEDVELTVGRPLPSFASLINRTSSDVDALVRR